MGLPQPPPPVGAIVLSVRPGSLGAGGTTSCMSALSYLPYLIVPPGEPLYLCWPRGTMPLLYLLVFRFLFLLCPV